jgi:hypothetical protein
MFAILIISLLILSHFLTDFYMQSDKISIFKHSALFLLCSITLTFAFSSFYLWFIIFIISILYFIFNKIKRSQKDKYLKTLIWFVSDHIIRLIVIIGTYPLLKQIKPNEFINIFLSKVLSLYPFLEVLNDINSLSYIVIVIAGFLFSIRGGTRLSLIIINLPKESKASTLENKGINEKRLLHEKEAAAAMENDNLNEIDESEISDEERMKYGKIIGIIERIIIITAVLLHLYQIIVIMTAIKSIGRFKEINNKTSDYYIIGNFASFSIAFFIGFTLLATKRLFLT